MKAIIIDLKETIRDVKLDEDILYMHELKDDGRLCSRDEMPMTVECKVIRKIYKGIEIEFPKDIKGYRRKERYYLDVEDWKLKIALIKGIIDSETAESRNKIYKIVKEYNRMTRDRVCKELELLRLKSKWYVRVGKKLDVIYNRIIRRKR